MRGKQKEKIIIFSLFEREIETSHLNSRINIHWYTLDDGTGTQRDSTFAINDHHPREARIPLAIIIETRVFADNSWLERRP